MERQNREVWVIIFCLLDEIPCQSNLWDKVIATRITEKNAEIRECRLFDVADEQRKGVCTRRRKIALQFIANMQDAYLLFCRFSSTRNRNEFYLNISLVGPTNNLVYLPNNDAMKKFPVKKVNFRCI